MPRAAPVLAADCGAYQPTAAIFGSGNCDPQEPAAPVDIPISIEPLAYRITEFGATTGCDGDSPDGPVSWRSERYRIADRPPEPVRGFEIKDGRFAIRCKLRQ